MSTARIATAAEVERVVERIVERVPPFLVDAMIDTIRSMIERNEFTRREVCAMFAMLNALPVRVHVDANTTDA
jgi:hypothetical protein